MASTVEEYIQANAMAAYDRLVAFAAEGAEAMEENKSLRKQVWDLEQEVQRLRCEVKTERELKREARAHTMDIHQEKERIIDLVAGRVSRGPVDPALLVRGMQEVLRWDTSDMTEEDLELLRPYLAEPERPHLVVDNENEILEDGDDKVF